MTLNRLPRMIFATSLLSALLAGCGQPNVSFQWTKASVTRNAQGVEVVRFDAAVSTNGLGGRQALYQVCIEDCDGMAVMSRDGRYRNGSGQVAAARTFHIGLPLQQISGLTVAIPISQLEAEERNLPISAQVGIYTPSGEMLATTRCPIPEEAGRASVATRGVSATAALAQPATGRADSPSPICPKTGARRPTP